MDLHIKELEDLRGKYCPPLDEPLFLSIIADYSDLADRDQLEQCVSTLDLIKAEALAEQDDNTFDPSGTGAQHSTDREHTRSSSENSVRDAGRSNEITSVTTALSDLNWDDVAERGDDVGAMSLSQKQQKLKVMFPSIDTEQIAEVLTEKDLVFEAIVERLLTLAFLGGEKEVEEAAPTTPVPKGIDGFFVVESSTKKRKGRSRKKNQTNDSSRASSTASGTPKNPWTATEEDIEFLLQKTALSDQAAREAYRDAGRNLAQTIKNLAFERAPDYSGLEALDPLISMQLIDLKNDFETLSEKLVFGLLVLGRIPPEASELAAVVAAEERSEALRKRNDLVQYAPVTLDENPSVTPSPALSPWLEVDHVKLRDQTVLHRRKAEESFAQASAAHRRGKSDHLMGGAASYYADEGHKRAKAAQAYRAAAADARVHTNRRTADSVDLHGVSVVDAVRIASFETQKWWDGLGDTKYTSAGRDMVTAGFHIVTGIGRHSTNNAPKLGPAVSKALMKEGWKVVVNQGDIGVHGRVKR